MSNDMNCMSKDFLFGSVSIFLLLPERLGVIDSLVISRIICLTKEEKRFLNVSLNLCFSHSKYS